MCYLIGWAYVPQALKRVKWEFIYPNYSDVREAAEDRQTKKLFNSDTYRAKAFSAPFQDVTAHNLPCLCQCLYNCTENGFSLSTLDEKPLLPIIESCNSNKFFLRLNGVWKPPVQLDVTHCYCWCLYQSNLFNVCFKHFFFVKVRKEDIKGLDIANTSIFL